MRILFDGFWWVRGPFSNRQVARQVVAAWANVFPSDDLVLAVPRDDLSKVDNGLPDGVRVMQTHLRPQGISAILELPLLARRCKSDIIIAHNFTPIAGRSAVFIQDLLFETNPEWFTRRERAYFSLMTWSMRRAQYLFSSSASEGDRMQAVGRAKVRSVPVGLGLSASLKEAEAQALSDFVDLPGFLLVVGRLNSRKNLEVGLEGALRAARTGPDFPVVVVGESSGLSHLMTKSASEAVESGAIRFAGFVSDEELAWLYQEASALIFMSRGEGFGLPNIEAMHFGTPVVASDIRVFREVLGNYGNFANPDDPDQVAQVIDEVLSSAKPKPVELASRGFTWEQCVRGMRFEIDPTIGAK